MQPQSKKLTPEEEHTLTSIFIVKIRELKKNDKINTAIMLNNLQALLDNQKVSEEFTNLRDFYLNPKLFVEEDVVETLLERKTILRKLLTNEIESQPMHKKVTTDHNKRRSLSQALGSSISSLLTNTQTIICWVYIEYNAKAFISALLTQDEQVAHDCLFKQTISSDTRCFQTSGDASTIISDNPPYQFQLYKRCLIPLLIGFEITTNISLPLNNKHVKLENYSPINITILTCILGNNKYSAENCKMPTEINDEISNKSPEFIKKYLSLFCFEKRIERSDKIIPKEIVRDKPKNGCILS